MVAKSLVVAAAAAGVSAGACPKLLGQLGVLNPIFAPGSGSVDPVRGETYDIKWVGVGLKGPLTVVLGRGPTTNHNPLRTLATGVPNTGSYSWSVPCDLDPDTTGYGIQIIDEDSCFFQYTTQHGISAGTKCSTKSSSAAAGPSSSAHAAPSSAMSAHPEPSGSYPSGHPEPSHGPKPSKAADSDEPCESDAPGYGDKPSHGDKPWSGSDDKPWSGSGPDSKPGHGGYDGKGWSDASAGPKSPEHGTGAAPSYDNSYTHPSPADTGAAPAHPAGGYGDAAPAAAPAAADYAPAAPAAPYHPANGTSYGNSYYNGAAAGTAAYPAATYTPLEGSASRATFGFAAFAAAAVAFLA